jgi:surface polysaccharide O-acyltransferase-like enzyme
MSLAKSFALMFLGYFLTAFATRYISHREGRFLHTYYEYLRPNVIVLSAGVFLVFKNLNFERIRWRLIEMSTHYVSKYSYGIYLAHWIVLVYLHKIKIDWQLIHPFIGVPVTTLACLFVALAITATINKIPYIGKYISG